MGEEQPQAAQQRDPDPVGPGREAEEPTGGDPREAEESTGGPAADGADEATEGALVEGELDQLVADLQKERDEYLQLAQRARADFENFRRRAATEASDAETRGKVAIGRAVLPALDNLERALAVDAEGLAEGVSLVHRELLSALSGAGVEAIDPAGEPFDPNFHEALSSRPAEDGETSGVVAETVQRGYRLGETLLRPARVVVTA